MPTFKMITGNYSDAVEGLQLHEHLYNMLDDIGSKHWMEYFFDHIYDKEKDKKKFQRQLEVIRGDLPRMSYVDFKYSGKEIKERLTNESQSAEQLSYNQCDFTARSLTVGRISRFHPSFMGEERPAVLKSIEMAYINDDDKLCGFAMSIVVDKQHPETGVDFLIAIIENTTSLPEERRVTIISSADLVPSQVGHNLEAANINDAVNDALKSAKIIQLLSPLIDQNGSVSMEYFLGLQKRIPVNSNIDHRDERRDELLAIIDRASKLPNSSPTLIEYMGNLNNNADDDINFYQDENFSRIKKYQESLYSMMISLDQLKEKSGELSRRGYTRAAGVALILHRDLSEKVEGLINGTLAAQDFSRDCMHILNQAQDGALTKHRGFFGAIFHAIRVALKVITLGLVSVKPTASIEKTLEMKSAISEVVTSIEEEESRSLKPQ